MSSMERTCSVDDRQVRYLEKGVGPPLVLVHGLGLSAGCWAPHLHRLARHGYRVIAPDLPGFGGSRGGRTGLSVPATAAWLDRFAAAVDVPTAVWVGHSLSCQALLDLAARRPGRVSALVLAAPTGRGYGLRRVGRQFAGLTRDAFLERPSLVARIVRRYLTAPIATTGTWLRSRRHRSEAAAAAVRAPVLIVLGENDPVVGERFAKRLATTLQDARITRLPDAAHAVALDPHRPFCDTVTAFLAD